MQTGNQTGRQTGAGLADRITICQDDKLKDSQTARRRDLADRRG
jgi:hypothetical protein